MIKDRNIADDAGIQPHKLLAPGAGEVFYVGTVATAAYNLMRGKVKSGKLFTSIDTAIGSCVADRGDIIYVLPKHTETITAAAGIALDVAGVSVIGLGNGSKRPTITFSTAEAADINISAEDCKISNFIFTSGINNLAMFLDVDASNFEVDGCKFVTANALEAYCFIDLATTKDNFRITNCEFFQPTDPGGTNAAASTGCIFCVDTENIHIENCLFKGLFETAIVHNRTTKVQNLVIKSCGLFLDGPADALPFVLVAASTGCLANCYGATLLAADAAEASVYGTLDVGFWICNTQLGNDSGGGGQNGVGATAAS